LNILHIHDQAGVACILAKFQEMQGAKSRVISLVGSDKYSIKEYYKDKVNLVGKDIFYQYCLKEADTYDIIHVHSVEGMVLKLRKKYGNKKKIILHYHGTDLRGAYKKRRSLDFRLKRFGVRIKNRLVLLRNGYTGSLQHTVQKLSDAVLVSTPDLAKLADNSIYLPNPIDTELFNKNNKNGIKQDHKYDAITIKTEAIDIQKTLNYIKERNLSHNVYVYDRISRPIKYKDMPYLLKQYNTFVDLRFVKGELLQNLSKTALESLACGLQVLNYQLKYLKQLSPEHEPVNVVKKLFNIYSGIQK
jgi:glycosyltransferase involved in cell wall biosynthesis